MEILQKWWVLVLISVFSTILSVFLCRRFLSGFEGWEEYGMTGVFLGAFVSNVTILFPLSSFGLAVELATRIDLVLVVALYTSGAVIGESAGHWIGRWGTKTKGFQKIEKKERYQKAVRWLNKHGNLAIFIFAALPFVPFDLLALAAGGLKYSFYQFFFWCLAGRFIKYLIWISGGIELLDHFSF